MASEMATAPPSERRRAATTAAKAAAIRVAIPSGVSPLVGATRMPASPASMALTAHTPTATRPGIGTRERGHRLGVDARPDVQADPGEPEDERAGQDHEQHEAVGDDLVGGHRGAEEVVGLVGGEGQAGGGGDGLGAEDEVGDGRKGDREPDGDHDLHQRGLVADEPEQHRVEEHPEERGHDQQRHQGRIGRGPSVLGVQPVVEAGDHEGHRPEGEIEYARRDEGDDQSG